MPYPVHVVLHTKVPNFNQIKAKLVFAFNFNMNVFNCLRDWWTRSDYSQRHVMQSLGYFISGLGTVHIDRTYYLETMETIP